MNRNTYWMTVTAISLFISTTDLTVLAMPNAMTATVGDAMHAQVELVDAGGKGTLHDADATERYHLANLQYDYTFGATGLLSIANRKAGVTVSVSDTPYAPVALTIERNGKREEPALASLPTRMRVIGAPSPTAVEYTWGTPETVQLTLRIEVVPNEPELTRWRIVALSAGPGVTITKIRQPVIRNIAIGKDATDDWFVAPGYERHGAGAYYNTTVTGNNAIPSRMGMAINWAACFDRSSGSGLGLLLDDLQDHDVDLLTARDTDGLRVSFEFPNVPDPFPVTYVAVHAGDWHWVADHFRSLVGAREPAPSNPAWAQDLDAWATAGFRDSGVTFNSLPNQYQNAAKAGARLLNIYGASCDGAWVTCGVFPYPNPYYGTEEELREAVTRVRDLGGHSIFYLNYQLTIPFGPSVKRIGPVPVALIPKEIPLPFMPPGRAPVTNRTAVGYGSDEFVAGRGLRVWSDRNLYWALHYATHYGADGIYWDQLSCCPGALKETAWNLARMTAECRKIVPGFITAGEGVGMAHGRNLTLGLSSAVFHHTEFYRYTFPSHLVIDGTANSANRWRDKRYENERFNAIFLDGSRFDGQPPDKTFADKTMALRQRSKQLLYQATFRDTEGVSLTFPDGVKNREPSLGLNTAPTLGIYAKRFVLNTPSSKLVLINTINNAYTPLSGKKDANGSYSTPPDYANDPSLYQRGVIATVDTGGVGPIRKAWVLRWGGILQPLEFKQVSNTAVSFEVPAAMQATVVLINRCEPLLYPALPVMTAAGAGVQAKIEVVNLDAEPLSGTLSWQVPSGWTGAGVKFGPIESGDTATLASLVTPDAHATRQLYDLECVGKTTEGRTGKRYASLSVVPSPYVDWNYDNDGNLRVTLRELTGKAATATVTLAAPPESGVSVGNPTQTVTVPAGDDLRVVCPLSGREKQSAPCVMRLSVAANGATQSLPVRLIPFLANGSFESTAGDGMPDFWQAIDYSGKVDEAELMPRVHLDDQVVYDGKYSLRIDPYIGKVKGFKGVSVYPASFKLLYNRKYRVTGQLRIPDDGSAYLIAGQDWQFTKPVGVRDDNGWQKFERTFTTGNPQWGFALSIGNTGPTPVWFDAITVAEVKE